MITSANIQVLFEWPNQTIIKIELFIFSSFFLSLVFIDNHTIKYDIEKYTKYSFFNMNAIALALYKA